MQMLSQGQPINVTNIARELKISFKATSNHLATLKNAEVVDSQGSSGHVFYTLNSKMQVDFRKALKLFLTWFITLYNSIELSHGIQ